MVILGINEIISLFTHAFEIRRWRQFSIKISFCFVCSFVFYSLLWIQDISQMSSVAHCLLSFCSSLCSSDPLQHGLDKNTLQSRKTIRMAYTALHTVNPVGVILALQRDKCMHISKGSAICSIHVTAWQCCSVRYRILACAKNLICKESTLSHYRDLLPCNLLPPPFTLPTHSHIFQPHFLLLKLRY